MNERRGPWYLLTGAVIGIALGLLIAWVVAPVQYVDATPATLRQDFKDEYRYMIAAAYSSDGNLPRARARLGLLGDGNPIQALGDQAQNMLANNASQDTVRILADLSQALQGSQLSSTDAAPTQPAGQVFATLPAGSSPSPQGFQTDTPLPATAAATADITATPPPTPLDTPTLQATHTATATAGPPFALANQAPVCDATRPGLLQINLKDASGQPVAGMELVVTWLGGEEHFFTGLKPELGNGYADFVMSPSVEYALTLSNGATRVTGLTTSPCKAADGSSYTGGIHLDFAQP